MKKLFLSGAVVVSFFLYSLFQKKITPTGTLVQTPLNNNNNSSGPTLKDGTYTGAVADAFYGNVQVQTIISGGKITTVNFLQSPNDRGRSVEINSIAMPILQSEAIQAQQANVDIVSGATDTSQAFISSLQSALTKAQ